MTKKNKISLPLISSLSTSIIPTGTPETETKILDGEILLPTDTLEGMTSDETPKEEPKEETPTETKTETPISNRMDELMIIQMEPETRFSGSHPKIKKHPKWMIGPKFNGRERWMDLTKITGWNLSKKQTILSRSEIQHRGYEQYIDRPYNPETDTDFTLLKSL